MWFRTFNGKEYTYKLSRDWGGFRDRSGQAAELVTPDRIEFVPIDPGEDEFLSFAMKKALCVTFFTVPFQILIFVISVSKASSSGGATTRLLTTLKLHSTPVAAAILTLHSTKAFPVLSQYTLNTLTDDSSWFRNSFGLGVTGTA